MRRHWKEALVLGLIVLIAVGVRVPTLDQPLYETHGFRQNQTASTVRDFHENGISWLHPRTPVLAESGEVPFEFPLFQAVATIPLQLGIDEPQALRGTALAFFAGSALALFFLARRLFGRAVAFVAAGVFCFMPFSVLWGRAFLIEYAAVFFSVLAAYLLVVFVEDKRWRWVIAGGVAGTCAMLVKPTTAAFWFLVPFATWLRAAVGSWKDRNPRVLLTGRTAALGAAVAIPLFLTALWTRHADHIKASDPATARLTSDALNEWNFGTWEQRFEPANWVLIFQRTTDLMVGIPMWIAGVLALFLLFGRSRRAEIAALIAICLLPVLVFFNLFVVHDYYQVALTAQVALVMALLAVTAVRSCRGRLMKASACAALALLATVTVQQAWETIELPYRSLDTPAFVVDIRETTAPNERIVTEGLDWDPTIPHTAGREAQMITSINRDSPEFAENLKDGDYRTLVTAAPLTAPALGLLDAHEWAALVRPGIIQFDDGDVWVATRPQAVVHKAEPEDLSTPLSQSAASQEANCDSADRIVLPASDSWTAHRLDFESANAQIVFDGLNNRLPVREWLVVPPTENGTNIGCIAGGSLVVTGSFLVEGEPYELRSVG